MQLGPVGPHPAIDLPMVLASAARVLRGVEVCKSHRSSKWGSHHQHAYYMGISTFNHKEVFHLL